MQLSQAADRMSVPEHFLDCWIDKLPNIIADKSNISEEDLKLLNGVKTFLWTDGRSIEEVRAIMAEHGRDALALRADNRPYHPQSPQECAQKHAPVNIGDIVLTSAPHLRDIGLRQAPHLNRDSIDRLRRALRDLHAARGELSALETPRYAGGNSTYISKGE